MKIRLEAGATAKDWDRVRRVAMNEIGSNADVPTWVRHVLEKDLDSLAAGGPGDAYVSCELRPVTESYMGFLREQIELNARGDQWTEVLATRLSRLLPHVGRPLLAVSIGRPGVGLMMRFCPQKYDLIHWECC